MSLKARQGVGRRAAQSCACGTCLQIDCIQVPFIKCPCARAHLLMSCLNLQHVILLKLRGSASSVVASCILWVFYCVWLARGQSMPLSADLGLDARAALQHGFHNTARPYARRWQRHDPDLARSQRWRAPAPAKRRSDAIQCRCRSVQNYKARQARWPGLVPPAVPPRASSGGTRRHVEARRRQDPKPSDVCSTSYDLRVMQATCAHLRTVRRGQGWTGAGPARCHG